MRVELRWYVEKGVGLEYIGPTGIPYSVEGPDQRTLQYRFIHDASTGTKWVDVPVIFAPQSRSGKL